MGAPRWSEWDKWLLLQDGGASKRDGGFGMDGFMVSVDFGLYEGVDSHGAGAGLFLVMEKLFVFQGVIIKESAVPAPWGVSL